MNNRIFMLVVIAGLALSACGAPPPAAPTQAPQPAAPTSAPAQQPVTIKFWMMPNGPDPNAAIDAEIAAFNRLHPEIKVEYEVVGWGDAYTKIQTAVQGGEGPCLTQLGTTWVPTFGSMGGLRPFSDAEVQAVGGAEAFVKASWDTAAVSGQVFALPWFADVRAIAYRKDLLQQAGLTPQQAFKDLESFEAALKTIKEKTGVAPIVHPGKNDWNVWQNAALFIWAYGGELVSPDGKSAAFASDAAVKGVTQFNSFFAKGLTPPDTLELNSSQAEGKFNTGEAATVIVGPWQIANARAPEEKGGVTKVVADNLAFAEFPAGPGGQYTFIGGSNLAILKTCQAPEAALTFINYLLTKESQVRFSQAIGLMPAKKEGQADPAFKDDPLYSAFIAASAKGKTSVAIPQWGQVENNLQTALQALWEDVAASGTTPISESQVKARLEEAANTVNTLLGQ